MSHDELPPDTTDFALLVRSSNGLALAQRAVETDPRIARLTQQVRDDGRAAAAVLLSAILLLIGRRRVKDLDAALFGYLTVLRNARPELLSGLLPAVIARNAGHWSRRLAEELRPEFLAGAPPLTVTFSSDANTAETAVIASTAESVACVSVNDAARVTQGEIANVANYSLSRAA